MLLSVGGAMGIVTKIYLKLVEKPSAKQTLLVFLTAWIAANTVSEMIASALFRPPGNYG